MSVERERKKLCRNRGGCERQQRGFFSSPQGRELCVLAWEPGRRKRGVRTSTSENLGFVSREGGPTDVITKEF